MSQGYVYILADGEMPGLVKIGMTRRSPEEIARALSGATDVPGQFRVVFSIYVDECEAVELLAHQELLEYRADKEFFRIELAEAISTVNRIAQGHLTDRVDSVEEEGDTESGATREDELIEIIAELEQEKRTWMLWSTGSLIFCACAFVVWAWLFSGGEEDPSDLKDELRARDRQIARLESNLAQAQEERQFYKELERTLAERDEILATLKAELDKSHEHNRELLERVREDSTRYWRERAAEVDQEVSALLSEKYQSERARSAPARSGGMLVIVSMTPRGNKDDTMDRFSFYIDEKTAIKKPGKNQKNKPAGGFMGVAIRGLENGFHRLRIEEDKLGFNAAENENISMLPGQVLYLRIDVRDGKIRVDHLEYIAMDDWQRRLEEEARYREELVSIDLSAR